jgi:hypothetical protein
MDDMWKLKNSKSKRTPQCRYTYLGVMFPLLLLKQVFKNRDGSEVVLYLVSSDLTAMYEFMT